MPSTVVYHANCPDGFCAAWLFHKVLPKATFVPANYGDPLPEVLNDHDFYIVDFSYPPEQLLDLAERANRVVVLDHHKTAKAALWGLSHPRLEVTFDMEKSGARLAWEYLFKKGLDVGDGCSLEQPPFLVEFVEDRDLWRHQLPYTHEINATIRSCEQDFATWDTLYNKGAYALISDGVAILRYRRQRIEEMKAQAVMYSLSGWNVPFVNCAIKDIQSEVAGELADPFAVCWYQMADGRYSYSLRSRGDFDVSKIAKQFGGGGHKNAAGFETEKKGAQDID